MAAGYAGCLPPAPSSALAQVGGQVGIRALKALWGGSPSTAELVSNTSDSNGNDAPESRLQLLDDGACCERGGQG